MNTPQDRNRKALGRGLESLLGSGAARPSAPAELQIPIGQIRPNPQQPRHRFHDAGLAELAASIKSQGVLQPVLVRRAPAGAGGYELVAGERRWRAAQLAELAEIPAIVREVPDQRMLEAALIENLQREDLNPMEQARAFQQLSMRLNLTQEQVAERTGKDRATIANTLRLLKLDPEVQAHVESGALTMGQARPLVPLDRPAQRRLAAEIIARGLSARQIEQRVQAQPSSGDVKARSVDANLADAQMRLTRSLGAKVRIRANRRHHGAISISFAGLDDFQRLFERLAGRE